MKKCFTINHLRTPAEIKLYLEKLIKTNLYQACEIFYPYQLSMEGQKAYFDALEDFLVIPNFEFILHLPFGPNNNLATTINLNQTKKRLKEAIEFGERLKVKKLTLHSGEIMNDLLKEDAIKLSILNVQELADIVKPLKMTIMVENLIGMKELCVSPNEVLSFLKEVNRPNVKFTFDCGHANVAGYKDLSSFVLMLKKYLYHLHLSDNFGDEDAHSLLGSGSIDFFVFFKTLKNINYNQYYCVEVFHQGLDDLIQMAKLMDKWYLT